MNKLKLENKMATLIIYADEKLENFPKELLMKVDVIIHKHGKETNVIKCPSK